MNVKFLSIILSLSFLLLWQTNCSSQLVPTPDHVVVVMLENHGYSSIIGSADAPYINSLANDSFGALFTQSFGVTHPSQPNYMYIFSGDNQNVILDLTPVSFLLPFSSRNLGASLLQNGRTFTGYSEDLPSVGYTGDNSGAYYRKHAPWVNWLDGATNGIPSALHQPFTSFPTNYNNLPTISFVIPNQQHDMHDGTINQADVWLQQNIDGYAQWAKAHNSLLIITFDEDDGLVSSNQIATIFIGQMVKQGQYNETINHNNVLRTMEDMYALPYAGASATATAITDCWVYKPVSAMSATPTAICPGDSIAFNDLTSHLPTSISWSFPGGTPSSSVSSSPLVTYTTAGVYDAVLIAANQMGADTLVMPGYITVHPKPILHLGADTFGLCLGDTASITASGANLYNWFPAPGLIYSNAGTMKANPATDAAYSVIGASLGCISDTAQVVIHVDSVLAASFNVNPSSDTTVCSGTILPFTSISTNGGNLPSYQWKIDGTNTGTNAPTFSTFALGSNYSVSCKFTSSAGCAIPHTITSPTIHVTVSQLPNPLITGLDSALSSTPAAGYQWLLNGQPIQSANSQTYIAISSGTYQVEAFNADGCSSLSNSLTVNLNTTGISAIASSSFSIYPNPSKGQFMISAEDKTTVLSKIEIVDLPGRLVYQNTLDNKEVSPTIQVNTQGLHNGTYLLTITSKHRRQTIRLQIE